MPRYRESKPNGESLSSQTSSDAKVMGSVKALKGRSLFIYELKRLELKAPATGQPGEKLDLR